MLEEKFYSRSELDEIMYSYIRETAEKLKNGMDKKVNCEKLVNKNIAHV